MVLDATELYTQSRLNALLSTRRCESDDDCTLLSCAAKCNLTKGYCTNRVNLNVEVFCSDLFPQLYGRRWPKSDWFVAACDTSLSMEERLTKLRLAWVWIVPDV
ncbi:unnamed protein product [Toxocara canis]|nr:unnamed protein product [Toxocara canis]